MPPESGRANMRWASRSRRPAFGVVLRSTTGHEAFGSTCRETANPPVSAEIGTPVEHRNPNSQPRRRSIRPRKRPHHDDTRLIPKKLMIKDAR